MKHGRKYDMAAIRAPSLFREHHVNMSFFLWSLKMSGLTLGTLMGGWITILAATADTAAALATVVVGTMGGGGLLFKLLTDHRAIERERETQANRVKSVTDERDKAEKMLETMRDTLRDQDLEIAQLRTQLAVTDHTIAALRLELTTLRSEQSP